MAIKGLAEIRRKLANIAKVKPTLMDRIGAYAVQAIIDRTQSGKDVNGKPFKPYSSRYAARRVAAGRGRKVDLNFKGNMLSAIKYRAGHKKVVIHFSSNDEMLKAHGHHFGNQKKGLPQRRFFGLSKNERKRIKEMVKRA